MSNGWLLCLTALLTMFIFSQCGQCKWSNENCEVDDDCCSKRCVKLHEGTDPRCEKSPIHYPCFFGYQCEKGLACGDMYSCCSPFWGVCIDKEDCCEKDHVCRQMDGFIYNRCLPNTANTLSLSSTLTLVLSCAFSILIHWDVTRGL